MKKLLSIVAAGVVAIPVMIGANAGAANAWADQTCGNGQVCLFQSSVWNGTKYSNKYATSWVSSGANDPTSNIVGYTTNPSYRYVTFFEHLNFGGNSFYMKEGQAISYLADIAYPGGGNWDNRISSHDESY